MSSDLTRPSAPSGPAPRALDDPATLRALVARLREGLYVLDGDGRILDANPAFAALVGADGPAELVGRSLDELVGDAPARARALAALGLDEGRAQELDSELLLADGSRQPVVERVSVVRGTDGTLRRLGIVTAVGEAARAEAMARDALTGCLDRAHLHALGERLARDAMAHTGVVVVRLEGRRADAHPDGLDALRQRVARFLMRHVRGDEPVVRLGDDDFLVVLAGARQEHTERVARRVQLLALRDAPAPLSLGWAAREHGESLAAVVARAVDTRVPVPHGNRPGDGRRRGEETQTRGADPAVGGASPVAPSAKPALA
jgi:PAS domain S-box-containing protein